MGKYLLSLGSQIAETAELVGEGDKTGDPSTWLVCLLGIAVVFGGLFLLIVLVDLMNACFRKKAASNPPESNPAPAVQAALENTNTVIENKQELIAAICAAVAEENGTDISAIRVISFKKL